MFRRNFSSFSSSFSTLRFFFQDHKYPVIIMTRSFSFFCYRKVLVLITGLHFNRVKYHVGSQQTKKKSSNVQVATPVSNVLAIESPG